MRLFSGFNKIQKWAYAKKRQNLQNIWEKNKVSKINKFLLKRWKSKSLKVGMSNERLCIYFYIDSTISSI